MNHMHHYNQLDQKFLNKIFFLDSKQRERNIPPEAISNIFEVLKTGGNLLCLEYEKDDLIIGWPPMSICIGSEELKKELSLIGFKIVKKTKINDAIYTVLAVKKEK